MTFDEVYILRIARQLKREAEGFRSLLRRNRIDETDLEPIRLRPRIKRYLAGE